MKSRMLISMLVIALAAAVIGGATMAWFTDEDASEPVTFTAGTLLIDLNENEWEQFQEGEINLDNLNPGDTWEHELEVKNIGTKNLRFTGVLCYEDTIGQDRDDLPDGMVERLFAKGYGTGKLSEVLQVELSVKDATWEVNSEWGQGVFYKGTLADYNNGTHPVGGLPPGFETVSRNRPIVFGEASLTPGEGSTQNSLTYNVKLSLPTTADNAYQGSKLRAALVVMARQNRDDAQYGEFVCPLAEAEQ